MTVWVSFQNASIGGGLFGKMADSLKAQFSCEIPNYQAYAKAAAQVFADYFKDKDVKPELLRKSTYPDDKHMKELSILDRSKYAWDGNFK